MIKLILVPYTLHELTNYLARLSISNEAWLTSTGIAPLIVNAVSSFTVITSMRSKDTLINILM